MIKRLFIDDYEIVVSIDDDADLTVEVLNENGSVFLIDEDLGPNMVRFGATFEPTKK